MMTEANARVGWHSSFPEFSSAHPKVVRASLSQLLSCVSGTQIDAWEDEIPKLQTEVAEVCSSHGGAKQYTAILEYELPMESRRADAILLVEGGVIVLEFKKKKSVELVDIDQTSAYARDLRSYHRACADHPVYPILVPTLSDGRHPQHSGVEIMGPEQLDAFINEVSRRPIPPLNPNEFLSCDAYCPLPTLVQAARELFSSHKVREIHRARGATQPTIEAITRIVHEAAATKTRHLILITGVPGSGKTLVGLQAVHAAYLDDLAVARSNGKPSVPAVFLSGNGPLVEVLQYQLRGAGGGGKTFVRPLKEYIKRYSTKKDLVPPEHVLVFDEAQRAFDADQVTEKHAETPGFVAGRSEPECFIEFAERIPEWCVVIGLIGNGQEIHVGEEAGIGQWREAIANSANRATWTAHVPSAVASAFQDAPFVVRQADRLNLEIEIRFHLAEDVSDFVSGLLETRSADENSKISQSLEASGYHLRITRDLHTAKRYLNERYADNPDARYGLLASSKDKSLPSFGILNDFQTTKRVQPGPWYSDSEDDSRHRSCRHLNDVVTEFGAQGLELDAALVAWGTDLILEGGNWTNRFARGYKRGTRVKDPLRLRLNSYRVLLTRGRDATILFVPPLPQLDEVYDYSVKSGFKTLG